MTTSINSTEHVSIFKLTVLSLLLFLVEKNVLINHSTPPAQQQTADKSYAKASHEHIGAFSS